MTIYNETFHPGQIFRGMVNGDIFTVQDVRDEPAHYSRRGPTRRETVVYFRHNKPGKLSRVGLETARRLMLEEVPQL